MSALPDPLEPAGSATPRQFESVNTTNVVKLVARREHCFHSLLELTRQLSPTLDVETIADRILFNLLGQLCTSRGALWLTEPDQPGGLLLVRSHGFRGRDSTWGNAPIDAETFARLTSSRRPVDVNLERDEKFSELAQANVRLLAPVFAGERPIGMLALGPRVSGSYGPVDVEVLEVAVGVAGTFLENARLHRGQRTLNGQLQRQNTMLVEMDKLRSEFVSNTNHELRTPLTIIQAALQCLEDFGAQSAQAPMLLHSAIVHTQHMTRLVEKLLTYADVRRGKLELPCVAGDVAQLLTEFFAQREGRLQDGAHPGSLSVAGGLPNARYHAEHLTHVLDELLDNALKFTPRGTRVRLLARSLTNQDGGWVAIELTDEGPGIPPAELERLFEDFVQGDGSLTRRVGGLGLGLALARQLVDGMGGRLEVESAVGRGTTFRALLAIDREPSTQAPAA